VRNISHLDSSIVLSAPYLAEGRKTGTPSRSIDSMTRQNMTRQSMTGQDMTRLQMTVADFRRKTSKDGSGSGSPGRYCSGSSGGSGSGGCRNGKLGGENLRRSISTGCMNGVSERYRPLSSREKEPPPPSPTSPKPPTSPRLPRSSSFLTSMPPAGYVLTQSHSYQTQPTATSPSVTSPSAAFPDDRDRMVYPGTYIVIAQKDKPHVSARHAHHAHSTSTTP